MLILQVMIGDGYEKYVGRKNVEESSFINSGVCVAV
jgi:hypothetical protein